MPGNNLPTPPAPARATDIVVRHYPGEGYHAILRDTVTDSYVFFAASLHEDAADAFAFALGHYRLYSGAGASVVVIK